MAGRTSRVFISYSHDSEEHARKVLKFADCLVDEGMDVNLDQYVANPEEGWIKWMDNAVRDADFVLLICTEKYRGRFEGRAAKGEGKGVKFESHLTVSHLYEDEMRNRKFIPICFDSKDKAFIPGVLAAYQNYVVEIRQPNLWDAPGFVDLYRWISRQPKAKKPKRRKKPRKIGGDNATNYTLVFLENSNETIFNQIENEIALLQKRLGQNTENKGIDFIIEPVSTLEDMQRWLRINKPSLVHFYGTPPLLANARSKTFHENNNHLFVEEEALETLFSAYLPFLKGVLIDGASSVEQVKAIANNGFHVISITCGREELSRMQFLTNFYKNFDLMENAGKAFLESAPANEGKVSENTDCHFTFSLMDGEGLLQYNLGQLEELQEQLEEEERKKAKHEKLLEERNTEKPQRAYFLTIIPIGELADWLNQEKTGSSTE
ncbi:MAG: TIR domain-containing protein [Lewinellaceae bacterium]|nr:TIR domain-containing protein [Lewinellaceae bacterium]